MHRTHRSQVDKVEADKNSNLQKITAKNGIVGALKNGGKDVKGSLKRLSETMIKDKDTPAVVQNFRRGFGTPSTGESYDCNDDDSPANDNDDPVTKKEKSDRRKRTKRNAKMNTDQEDEGFEILMSSILSESKHLNEVSGVDTSKIIDAIEKQNESMKESNMLLVSSMTSSIQSAFAASMQSLTSVLEKLHLLVEKLSIYF